MMCGVTKVHATLVLFNVTVSGVVVEIVTVFVSQPVN